MMAHVQIKNACCTMRPPSVERTYTRSLSLSLTIGSVVYIVVSKSSVHPCDNCHPIDCNSFQMDTHTHDWLVGLYCNLSKSSLFILASVTIPSIASGSKQTHLHTCTHTRTHKHIEPHTIIFDDVTHAPISDNIANYT